MLTILKGKWALIIQVLWAGTITNIPNLVKN